MTLLISPLAFSILLILLAWWFFTFYLFFSYSPDKVGKKLSRAYKPPTEDPYTYIQPTTNSPDLKNKQALPVSEIEW